MKKKCFRVDIYSWDIRNSFRVLYSFNRNILFCVEDGEVFLQRHCLSHKHKQSNKINDYRWHRIFHQKSNFAVSHKFSFCLALLFFLFAPRIGSGCLHINIYIATIVRIKNNDINLASYHEIWVSWGVTILYFTFLRCLYSMLPVRLEICWKLFFCAFQ